MKQTDKLSWFTEYLSSRIGIKFISTQDQFYYEFYPESYKEKKIIIAKCQAQDEKQESNNNLYYWNPRSENINFLPSENLLLPFYENNKNKLIEIGDESIKINYDFVENTFWILTRKEELNESERDKHLRFPYHRSHAFRHDYIKRPIVDEWISLIKQILRINLPSITITDRKPRIKISCDVDRPYQNYAGMTQVFRRSMSSLIRKRSPSMAFDIVSKHLFGKKPEKTEDSWYKNITWIMDINERYGNTVQFNFLCGGCHPLDGHYNVHDTEIKNMIISIVKRGHEIGIHPSYESFCDREKLTSEVTAFRELLEEENIGIPALKSRQHYLRWDSLRTPVLLDSCNVSEDSSLGYAETIGFRVGTSHPFKMFDHTSNRKLNLTQSPLLIMESSLLAQSKDTTDASDQAEEIWKNVKLHGGDFTLLWHNSDINSEMDKETYTNILKILK